MEHSRMNVLDRSVVLLRRYYEVAPAATIGELRALLQRIEQRLGKSN
jgi:hypothetical protein